MYVIVTTEGCVCLAWLSLCRSDLHTTKYFKADIQPPGLALAIRQIAWAKQSLWWRTWIRKRSPNLAKTLRRWSTVFQGCHAKKRANTVVLFVVDGDWREAANHMRRIISCSSVRDLHLSHSIVKFMKHTIKLFEFILNCVYILVWPSVLGLILWVFDKNSN